MSRRRVILAFLLAPLAVPLPIFALFFAMHLMRLGWFASGDTRLVLVNALTWSVCAIPIALGVTIAGGVPCHLVFQRRGWVSARHYVLAGLILGAAPFAIYYLFIACYDLWRSVEHGLDHQVFGVVPTLERLAADVPVGLAFAAVGVVCGLCSSFTFWLVAFPQGVHEHRAT